MSAKNVVICRTRMLGLAVLVVLAATGCSTYKDQNRVIHFWRQNNLTNAVTEATKLADKKAGGKDAIIWRLEQGAVLRGNGQYQDSNVAFDKAQARIDQYAQEAKVKVGSEAAALLSNQANLPYVGRAYDGIMLNTYKALNYLQLGEPDKARVELIRAYQRQQGAVEDNKKRIEKTQQEVAKSKDKKMMDKTEKDPKFKAKMQGTYADLDKLKTYADYVNPFTVYLDGLFFMANAADASDLERAHKSLERVVGFNPENPYVKRDLEALDGVMQGKPLPPTTYVIFETGCAPQRDQIRIDIPIFVAKVSYVGAAFPTLKNQGDYIHRLKVTANSPIVTASDAVTTSSSTSSTTGETNTALTSTTTATGDTNATIASTTTTTGDTTTTVTSTTTTTSDTNTTVTSTAATTGDTNAPGTSTTTTASSTTTTTTTASSTSLTTVQVASMDSVIGLDFKNELPVIITKTIASTVAKAAAAYAANQAANQQDALFGALMQIGTAIYQAAVNIADTRTWTTLPKEFQVCSFPTPPDRKIVLESSSTAPKIPVTIGDGTINIVYVKSITATGPLLVTQFKLK